MAFLPPHFTVYDVELPSANFDGFSFNTLLATGSRDEESAAHRLTRWIYDNLEGRFFVGQAPNQNALCFGFERPEEATYFGLIAQGLVNKKD